MVLDTTNEHRLGFIPARELAWPPANWRPRQELSTFPRLKCHPALSSPSPFRSCPHKKQNSAEHLQCMVLHPLALATRAEQDGHLTENAFNSRSNSDSAVLRMYASHDSSGGCAVAWWKQNRRPHLHSIAAEPSAPLEGSWSGRQATIAPHDGHSVALPLSRAAKRRKRSASDSGGRRSVCAASERPAGLPLVDRATPSYELAAARGSRSGSADEA